MSFIRKIKKGGRVYLAKVENRRVDGKVVQKHLRYVGREADGEEILSATYLGFLFHCSPGPYIAC